MRSLGILSFSRKMNFNPPGARRRVFSFQGLDWLGSAPLHSIVKNGAYNAQASAWQAPANDVGRHKKMAKTASKHPRRLPRSKCRLFPAFALLFAVGLALAEGTRVWKESGFDDFQRGTARGVAIRSTGQLELAPVFKPIYTSPSTFIWGIAADKDGVVYAAT